MEWGWGLRQCAPLAGHSPALPPLPASCSPFLHSTPNFFPRQALRKRTSVRSLGRPPARLPPLARWGPPSPPAISPWRLPSHVTLRPLSSFLQDPDLTPQLPLSSVAPVLWGTTPRCRELGHQLCLAEGPRALFFHLSSGIATRYDCLDSFHCLFFPYCPIAPSSPVP